MEESRVKELETLDTVEESRVKELETLDTLKESRVKAVRDTGHAEKEQSEKGWKR